MEVWALVLVLEHLQHPIQEVEEEEEAQEVMEVPVSSLFHLHPVV